MKKQEMRVASLFSGVGGFEIGLKMSELEHKVIFTSEIDKHAQRSYIENFGDDYLHGDITLIDEKDILNHDLMCAGFPCQAFSIAGQRQGFDDTRGTLFFDVARILKEKQPKFVLLENVKNLISHDKSRTIKIILSTLNDLGYTVDFSVVNSSESGVPQNRDRTYIVGVLKGEVEEFESDRRSKKITSLKKDLQEMKIKGFNFFNSLKFENKYSVIADILQDHVEEKYYFNSDDLEIYLSNLDIEMAKEKAKKIMKLLDLPIEVHNDLQRQRRVYSIYGISPTILARADSTKVILEKEDSYRIRKFTPIENFLAQGFTLDFVMKLKNIGISDAQLYKQSGNAVSPPVIKQIINHMKEVLIDGK